MNDHPALTLIARRLSKEWNSWGVQPPKITEGSEGVTLKSAFSLACGQQAVLTAEITPGLNRAKTANLVLGTHFACRSVPEKALLSLCAFLQEATAQLSPMALLVDVENSRLLIRQSQIIALEYPLMSRPLYDACLLLIEGVKQSANAVISQPMAPEQARELAQRLAVSYHGVPQQ